MESYREERCCDYYEKDRTVYEEPHLRHHRRRHDHNLLNNNAHGDSFRFKEERHFEEQRRHGGNFAGGEGQVVTYKVEETDYAFNEAGEDGGYLRQHYGRHIY